MHRTRPLVQLDPGWLFLLAGLAVCAAGMLLPASDELRTLRDQKRHLDTELHYASDRLHAYSTFLDAMDRDDPTLLRRLAASQLNLIPADETAVVLGPGRHSTVEEWVERTVAFNAPAPTPWPETRLRLLGTGPWRLWMIGGGVLAVFVGLMLGPSVSPNRGPDPSAE